MVNSWMILSDQKRELKPESSLFRDDVLKGADCGFIEQMIPFLREFSKPGELVLDPFAGWGSTLIAALLEGRNSLGIEIEEARVARAKERIAGFASRNYHANAMLGDSCSHHVDIMYGDSRSVKLPDDSVDLILTSIPYFRELEFSQTAGQLYNELDLQVYLKSLEEVIANLKSSLKRTRYIILMAENLSLPGKGFVPLAWKCADILSKHFEFQHERIICYQKEHLPNPLIYGADGQVLGTNRAHEYVLVARKL